MTTTKTKARYVKTIGIVNNGDNGRGFANPYDTAHTQDGRIYVINRCTEVIHRNAIRVGICNLDEEYLGEFGYGYGNGDGQFMQPVAMSFDSQEHLYITDEHNNRVTVFESDGKFLSKWGVPGTGPGQMRGPSGIAVDSDDNIYVADQHNHRVQIFSPDGDYITGWGKPGSGEGEFNMPWGITLDAQSNVYVADWQNDRIQKFSSEGRFLASFGRSGNSEGEFSRPSSVAVNREGVIYVADWGNERVQLLGPNGDFIQILRGEATLSQWAKEFFDANPDEQSVRDISDLHPELPHNLNSPDHASSQIEEYFWGPVSVKLDHQERLYVTETNRHRFQIYQKG